MRSNERKRRRFSEDFRRNHAEMIEQGIYTIPEVCRLYDVSYNTVKNWVKGYGKKPYPKTVRVNTEKDIDRLRELEKEVDKLKGVIGDQHIQILYQNKLIEMAKERLGDDFEKKCSSHY